MPNSGIDATAKAIQVGSQAVLATADGGQTSFLGGNIYPSGTFEQKYLTTNAGSSIQLLGGEVILNAYDIGTASATVSPTPDGNLVVGSGYVGVGGQLIVDNGIAVTTGDVAIPDKIVHAGDTNTTIRFPAADTVTVETNGVERMRITSTGNVGIGTTTPAAQLHVSATTTNTAQITASISGTTMNVTEVTAGTLAVGNVISGGPDNVGVSPITKITAFGTGSGNTGTYTVSVSQTVPSTSLWASAAGAATIRLSDTDTGIFSGQPSGTIEFAGSAAASPGAGVGAYISAVNETNTPDTALTFGTRNNTGGGIDAKNDFL